MTGELEDAKVVYIFKCEPGYGLDLIFSLHEMWTIAHEPFCAMTIFPEKRTVMFSGKIATNKRIIINVHAAKLVYMLDH